MRWQFLALVMATLAACSTTVPKPDKLVLEPVSFQQMRGWADDKHAEAHAAFLKSCMAFAVEDDEEAAGQGPMLAPAVVWKALCRRAQIIPAADHTLARQFFERDFVPFRVKNNGEPTGLITGYYEPLLMGSRQQKRPYVYPLYPAPPPGTPGYTRAQIDQGALAGQVTPIAYVDDPVQLFFLHIQGSGRIQLDDGTTMRVGYAGSNGQKYVAIGRVMVDRGIMTKEAVTMPALRQWLYDHPQKMWEMMWENPAYVFFREYQGEVVGTQRVPLTASRSIAVDQQFIPLGTPVFIDTILPETPYSPMTMDRRLYVAQDTGGAIRGPARADIFFGFGTLAEQLAGRLKAGGELTMLVPRAIALKIQPPESEAR